MNPISVAGKRKHEPQASDLDDPHAVDDRAASIENTFLSNLDAGTRNQIGQNDHSTRPISLAGESRPQLPKGVDREEVLVSLYDVYDNMIMHFESMDYTNTVAQKVSNNIIKLGSCIATLGGEVENFSPLDHVSGLSSPPMMKNAQQVVERTKTCYKRADIEDVSISDTGKVIDITLVGQDDNVGMAYRAKGTLQTNSSWSGAEAIDYIYTPEAGKMSVKVLEDDRWVDRSPNYKISWELQELDITTASVEEMADFQKGYKKEGEISNSENKVTVDSDVQGEEKEIDLCFPVEEK